MAKVLTKYRLTFLRYVASAELGDLVPTILIAQTEIAYLGDQCKPTLSNGTQILGIRVYITSLHVSTIYSRMLPIKDVL